MVKRTKLNSKKVYKWDTLLIIPFFHVISGADYREQPRLLFLFLISVIKCEDLCNYFVRINPALTEGLLVRESDRSSSWEQMFAKCF